MSESGQPLQPSDYDKRWDEVKPLEHAVHISHGMIDSGPVRPWLPVGTSDLDASKPLTERESAGAKREAEQAVRDLSFQNAVSRLQQELYEKDHKIRELEEDVRTDELTGLRTFTVLKDDMPRAIALSLREHTGFMLWAVDGIGLSEVNNIISRSAGDEYIKEIAAALQVPIRKSEGVYRGGTKSDEFFVMMPLLHVSSDGIDKFIAKKQREFEEELARRIEINPLLGQKAVDLGLGIYIGTAFRDFAEHQTRSNKKPEHIARELFEKADEDIRAAKNQEKKFKRQRSKY